jgi:hypothetical protein
MRSLCLVLISLFFLDNSFPQVPILFYDFESNTNRNTFENSVESYINPGSGPLVRHGGGTIYSGAGNNFTGCGIYGNNWQNTVNDPGTAATDYYQFNVNTTGFKGISVRFRYYIPFQTGPGNFGLLLSTNGTTFKKIWTYYLYGPNNSWNDVMHNIYDYPEINNKANIVLRFYAFKGNNTGSGGLMALDNLMITADTVLANAGNITLLDEKNTYNCYYSGGTGRDILNYYFTINGPGTTVKLCSPLNNSINFSLNKGAVLDCGDYPVWGLGNFTINGGTLSIGSSKGITLSPDTTGNITVKGTRIYDPFANYFYNGSAAQETGNGLPASLNSLTINNSSGVTLTNSLLVKDTLKLVTGKVNLRNKDLVIGDTAFVAGGSADSYVVTDSSGGMIFNHMARGSDIKFCIGTPETYNPLILNYTGTIDTFKVSVKSSFDNPPVDANRVVNRQWTVTENNPGGTVASIKLFWLPENEASGFNSNSQVMIGQYESTGWTQIPAIFSGAGTASDPFAASIAGITQFCPLGVGNDSALPVELISFTGELINANVNLRWTTATEINSNSFDIERKNLSGNNWLKIGNVGANFLSNSPRHYSFIDKKVNAGEYSYRLKMIDNDGAFKYSNLVEMKINPAVELELFQNYPNPFNPTTKINYRIPVDSDVLIEVFNILGSKVACLVNEFKEAGDYHVEFNPQRGNISSGVYYYKIITIARNTGNRSDLIKKMIYLK